MKNTITTFAIAAALAVTASSGAGAQQDEYPLTAEVTAASANVRTDSTVGAESICMLSRKQRVEIIGQAYDWYKIKLPSLAPAYVSQQYVEVSGEENDEGEITGNNVNIRLKPELGGSILGQAHSGDKVRILGKSGNWYRVKPPEDATGWVHKSMVSKPVTSPAVRTKQKQEPKQKKEQKQEPKKEPHGEPAAVQAEKPQAAPARDVEEIIVIEGVIRPKVMTQVATHKITDAARSVYLLRSRTLDLKLFTGRPVRVSGMLVEGTPLLVEVLKVEETSPGAVETSPEPVEQKTEDPHAIGQSQTR